MDSSFFSDKFFLDNGMPQGRVISPTLFNIVVNDLIDLNLKCLLSQLTDDTSIHKSNTKTQDILFTDRNITDNTKINFNGDYLDLEKFIKFLDILFD